MKFLTVLFMLVSMGVCAMEMPKDEFLKLSKLVVVGEVAKVASWTEPTEGMLLYDFEIKTKECLRGQLPEKIVVRSYGNVTGSPELEFGKIYVMFLQWNEEQKAYLFVNGVQGCWEVYEDGILGGMGRGRSLDKLREYFASKAP